MSPENTSDSFNPWVQRELQYHHYGWQKDTSAKRLAIQGLPSNPKQGLDMTHDFP